MGPEAKVQLRINEETAPGRKPAAIRQRLPTRSTGPPRFIGVPLAPQLARPPAGRNTTSGLTTQPAG